MKRCVLLASLLLWKLTVIAQYPSIQDKSAAGIWPEYGGDLSGQRYSTAAEINRDNVRLLKPEWVMHTRVFSQASKSSNPRASFEATPVLWNKTLYVDTPFDEVFAIDAATGKVRWSFDPKVDREKPIYIVTSRGVSLWHAAHRGKGLCANDRVFVATVDRRLIALDAQTGVPCPTFGKAGVLDLIEGVEVANRNLYEFTSPATVVGNTVILGSSVADNQKTWVASGAIRGFDVFTGHQKWAWEPIRWTTGDKRTAGSGNAWSVISADLKNDLIFVPTGSPSVDFYGGTRLGDNRDADSLIALRASTGERVWGFQLVHHDIWDYDVPSEPVLFTFRKSIPAVAVTTKTNMVYVFNRLTGEPLYPVVERAVPASTLAGEQAWPTQPFSSLPPLSPLSFSAADLHMQNADDQKFCEHLIKSYDYRGLFTPPSQRGSIVYPGSLGGSNWGSSAFDPQTSILYTRISNLPFLVRQQRLPPGGFDLKSRIERKAYYFLPEWAGGKPKTLHNQFKTPDSGGEERDESPQMGTPYALARQALMTAEEVPCVPEPFGAIVATNLDTGKQVWSVPHGEMAKGYKGSVGAGGVIATAGNLIFGASTNDPYIRAYDSVTGKELWRGELPAVAEATPMTYTVNGRQYVVIAAGGHGFIGKGKSDALVAFALPATKDGHEKGLPREHGSPQH